MPPGATDYLKKPSSNVLALNQHSTPAMDDLIQRELDRRILDEACEPPLLGPDLVSRLFPPVAFAAPDTPKDLKDLATRLNLGHHKLQHSAARTLHKNRRKAVPTPTTRKLRPRPQTTCSTNTKGKGSDGKDRKEDNKKPKKQAKAKGDGDSIDEEKERDGEQGNPGPGELLYDLGINQWNLEVGEVTKVDGTRVEEIEEVVDEHFAKPQLQTLFTDTSDPDLPVDGLSQNAQGRFTHAEQSLEVPQQIETDVEEAGTTDEGSFDGPPRRGAALDGDSSRDKDWFEGNKGKKEKRPSSPLTSESRRAGFMNTLAAVLSLLSHPSDDPGSSEPHPRRWWYGTFSTKPLASDDGESHWNRKPDLILIEGTLCDDHNSVTWKSPKAIAEMTESTFSNNKTLLKSLNSKAYILLSSQPWRRYVIALSFAASELRVHYFDRSGAQISAPIDYHRRIEETCKIVYALARGDKCVLGFDPTLRLNFLPSIPRPRRPQFMGIVEVDGTEYDIVSILWTSNGFIGRGTVCFHVRLREAPLCLPGTLDEFDLVLKDCWVEAPLVEHEHSVLKRIAGLEGVPSLIKAWTVQYDGKDDNTVRYRPEGWIPSQTSKFVPRIHRRLLMTPVGSPLSTFRSQKEFLLGLIDGLQVHEQLVEKGVLHRDVSPNNLVFRRDPQGFRKVLLIDYDYAVGVNEEVQYPHGTGTLPFVSLMILRQVTWPGRVEVRHEVADDLESFFYVFMWFCVLFTGPNGSVRSPPQVENTSILQSWGDDGKGLTHALSEKSMFIHAPNQIIDWQFTPYFNNLKELAYEWRALVRLDDLRRDNPPRDAVLGHPLTHKRIIGLLQKWVDRLPDFDVFLLPPPQPFPCETSPTPPFKLFPRGSKRSPPSPQSSVDTGPKRRRHNSSGSIGTGWLPVPK